MSDSLIVFSAFVLPDAMKREIIQVRNRVLDERGINPGGFEREEKLHITVRYFGEIGRTELNGIFRATEQSIGIKPFEISFNGFSLIYRNKVPKVLYASVTMSSHAYSLVSGLEQRYNAIGYESDIRRPFLPHITIKRIRMNGDEKFIQYFPEKTGNPKTFLIDTFAIYESVRTEKGSTYKYLKTYNLEG